MESLVAAELRRLLNASARLAQITTPVALRGVAVEIVFDLVPSTRAGWVMIDLTTGAMSGHHLPEPIPFVIPLMPRVLSEVPMVAELLAAPEPGSLRISGTLTVEEWHARPLYAEVYRPLGGEYQIGTLLSEDDGLVKTLAVFRSESDFTDRELALVEKFARYVRATLARLPAAAARDARGLLISRQRHVLAALESGVTVRQAANTLIISEKTLENHLQTIYRRLGVSSRTAALNRLNGRAVNRWGIPPIEAPESPSIHCRSDLPPAPCGRPCNDAPSRCAGRMLRSCHRDAHRPGHGH